MNRVAVALWNPIVAKEYRSRMRTWRSPLAMTVYILLLGGLGWTIFSAMSAAARNVFNGSPANYGQALFLSLVIFQMVLLAFITPALTAGASSLLYGLLFPTSIDPNATTAPAPPAVSYISPLLPLVTIGTSQPVTWYGIGSGFSSGGGGGMMCSGTPGGGQSCVPLNASGKGVASPIYRNPPQPTGTTIPSGLFAGWQYWQATITLQLLISLAALVLSAILIPPTRRPPWARRTRAAAGGS